MAKDHLGKHFPPPGFSKVDTKYDLILNPIGLKSWTIIFGLLSIVGYMPLVFFKDSNHYLPIFVSVTMQFFAYFQFSNYSRRTPLFQSAWKSVGDSYSLWFKKIPQKVKLHKKDIESISWWGSDTLKPASIRMPINISQGGSAQQSIMLSAMQQIFIEFKNTGAFGEMRIYLYWLKPLLYAIAAQFFYITVLLSIYILPYDKVKDFPAVMLIFPAFCILVGAVLFLVWSWKFISYRQNETTDYLKYSPAGIEGHLPYIPTLYSKYDRGHIIKVITLIITITFSGILFLISILNEYNPPKKDGPRIEIVF